MSGAGDGDRAQYSRAGIEDYERVYGAHFVSPGGADAARECIGRLAPRPGDRVLDAGCGLGGSAFLLATEYGARPTGVDLSAPMIEMARERRHALGLEAAVALEQGDLLALEGEACFDAVLSRDVFLHVHDKARLFRRLRRLLVPGGRLLITDYCCGPAPWSAGFAAYVAARAYHLLTVARYADLLAAAGLEVLAAEDRSARFIELNERELARMAPAGEGGPPAAMVEAWRAKLARARAGEQRWGLFLARRPDDDA